MTALAIVVIILGIAWVFLTHAAPRGGDYDIKWDYIGTGVAMSFLVSSLTLAIAVIL